MDVNNIHLINLTFLENRIGELGLKNWWVAEYIGVDRKTLTRWLTGKVKHIKHENLLSLADCLKCSIEDLTIKDEASIIASQQEQAVAAQLIVQENLLETLTPSGQWPLLESIVKATMQPNLPSPIMGKLYNLLSVCSWRQSEIDKAKRFADKALEIGIKNNHIGVIAQAKNNLAIIYSYKGQLKDSISLYEEVINLKNYIDEDRVVASAISNLAQDYQSYGDFNKSRDTQMEAIKMYKELNLPLNLSIAYCALGLLETEEKNFDLAKSNLERSLELAKSSNYLRGQYAAKIYLADCAANQKDFVSAQKLLEEGFAGFKELKLNEALNFEIAARLNRFQNNLDKSELLLIEGLRYAIAFRFETASLYIEYSKLWSARNNTDKSKEYKQQALDIYQASGAEMRLQNLK